MKVHSWKEIIRYFLEQNDYRNLWDYVTALRGGDGIHDIWKSLITCIIRGKDLNKMGWDVTTTKDLLKCYDNKYIIHKLNVTFGTIPSHFIIHGQMGLSSLAVYYRDAMNNRDMFRLLLTFESKLAENDLEGIPSLVRQILKTLYKNE